jgi:hypothetical protein
MVKRPSLLFVAALGCSPAAGAQQQQRPGVPAPTLGQALNDAAARPCKSSSADEVVVCGRSSQRYRLDPNVLASERAAEARPPKPLLDASTEQSCVGPNCGGATIPLVGMALTALKAAELAAQGDDWREAFRTRPDAYQAYQDAKAREGKRPRVSVGISAGTSK